MIEHDVVKLKTRVAKLERAVEFLLQHIGVPFNDTTAPAGPPEVIALVRDGKKIEAIKRYMALTGADMLAAKEFVDAIE